MSPQDLIDTILLGYNVSNPGPDRHHWVLGNGMGDGSLTWCEAYMGIGSYDQTPDSPINTLGVGSGMGPGYAPNCERTTHTPTYCFSIEKSL